MQAISRRNVLRLVGHYRGLVQEQRSVRLDRPLAIEPKSPPRKTPAQCRFPFWRVSNHRHADQQVKDFVLKFLNFEHNFIWYQDRNYRQCRWCNAPRPQHKGAPKTSHHKFFFLISYVGLYVSLNF